MALLEIELKLFPGFPRVLQVSTLILEVATKVWPLMVLLPPKTRPWGMLIFLLSRAGYSKTLKIKSPDNIKKSTCRSFCHGILVGMRADEAREYKSSTLFFDMIFLAVTKLIVVRVPLTIQDHNGE